MPSATTLHSIEEGMKVFDRDHQEIGRVEYVQFGDDDPTTHEAEAAGPNAPRQRDSLIRSIADAFSPGDRIPDELRNRLVHRGFVRLDAAGLFEADRYITPEQIESVSSEGLILNVTRDELVKH